jgi:outer membrane protein assembly factor BamB
VYARIQNGVVVELFTPPAGATLVECFHADIAATFVLVPPGVTPAQGWTFNGTNFAAPSAPPPPTPAQQAQTLFASGLTITSTSGGWAAPFPCLTDATGANVWTLVLAEQTALSLSGGAAFADGAATVQWPDAAGVLHALTPAQFQAFMRALGLFVAGCRNVINGVPGAALPAASATIP